MKPNFEKIVKELFHLKKGDKVRDAFDLETNLEELESTLGPTGSIAYPDLKVPIEVTHFFGQLYEYVQNNHS